MEAAAEADPEAAAVARAETDGSAWYRVLEPDDTLGTATLLADGLATDDEDAGAVAPVVVLPDGTAVTAWRMPDGRLLSRTVSSSGELGGTEEVTERRVVQNPSDSEQVGVDLIAYDGRVHMVFADVETSDLWYAERGEGGGWSPAEPLIEGITAQWMRGEVVRAADGSDIWGIVYDAGSDGGSGMNWYVEVPLGGG